MTAMTPIDWAKRPLQKYADFTGRAPRAEYWWFVLAMVIIFVVLTIVESIVGLNKMVFGVYGPLTTLLWLGVLVPSLRHPPTHLINRKSRHASGIVRPAAPGANGCAVGRGR